MEFSNNLLQRKRIQERNFSQRKRFLRKDFSKKKKKTFVNIFLSRDESSKKKKKKKDGKVFKMKKVLKRKFQKEDENDSQSHDIP